jgi:hypothetical protein
MEPPTGFWASLLSFLKFLPYFSGLLILGFIKGDLLFCLFALCSFQSKHLVRIGGKMGGL